ncbi:MAG: CBS domain-containing protein, partial [Thermoplasmatales archaeon]
ELLPALNIYPSTLLYVEKTMMPSLNEIKRLREKLNITQKELSRMTGFSQSYIARLERNELNPTYESIRKIFDTLEGELAKREGYIKRARDIMSWDIISVTSKDKLSKAIRKLADHGFSQLPVIDRGVSVGSITDNIIRDIISKYEAHEKIKGIYVKEVMGEPFPQVSENAPVKIISYILTGYQAVLVSKEGKIVGIITKSDLLKTV